VKTESELREAAELAADSLLARARFDESMPEYQTLRAVLIAAHMEQNRARAQKWAELELMRQDLNPPNGLNPVSPN